MPQDQGLRFMLAMQNIETKDIDMAKALLRPLAFDPHMPPDNPAAQLLASLDKGDRADVQKAMAKMSGPGASE